MARTHRRAQVPSAPPSSGAGRASRRRAHAPPDPEQDDHDLHAQLERMGLYAADTRGDGNCLFRALSDQLYGDPKYHAHIRAETCDHLAKHADMYAGFVESDTTFDVYVERMRALGTYGGHLELSAFANLKQKRIRIVQSGCVYIVACDDDSYGARASRERRERHRRHLLADTGSAGSSHAPQNGDVPVPECVGPLHIAYHSWEHYSSLRAIGGPHHGHPCIPDTGVGVDADDARAQADAEAERLVCMSAPGHSLRTVRRLLSKHNGAWEDVVEELIQRDADAHPDTDASDSASSASSSSSRKRKLPPRSARRSKKAQNAPSAPNSSSSSTSAAPVTGVCALI